jgi:hypothetical protein
MRYSRLILILAMFLFVGNTYAQFGPKPKEAKKDGWWIKATDVKQKGMMAFYVGETGSSYGFWTTWSPGDPAEFDVPEEFRNGNTVYILAQTTSGEKSQFCIMHKSKGVKFIEYDLEADYMAKQSEQDKKCE